MLLPACWTTFRLRLNAHKHITLRMCARDRRQGSSSMRIEPPCKSQATDESLGGCGFDSPVLRSHGVNRPLTDYTVMVHCHADTCS
ncbi:uncharacterized protein L969DRAFT_97375 [Mixia osmundae IAM 14324]|uniref:Uncharacterized protein n=1 Tax=Mixia osmundae (strain CBS 9802 / IAM 14324 / JCM 22182 / KY 12970) TaxID=764103 RepID=G7DVH1_MIXOS|nr:uncharacterized protein L969DRAFT_97375 [Mixia osmundae IAM 14324]KEI36365.1 hypothetical protein L969DRAFT_97375 [Mixia osmundae IAM 14324]GAA94581.1 hypothetical protein E5Q_01233 [Mixia osmundae IAM 14324]